MAEAVLAVLSRHEHGLTFAVLCRELREAEGLPSKPGRVKRLLAAGAIPPAIIVPLKGGEAIVKSSAGEYDFRDRVLRGLVRIAAALAAVESRLDAVEGVQSWVKVRMGEFLGERAREKESQEGERKRLRTVEEELAELRKAARGSKAGT